ncbi:MAG: GGDEF domain-containing protein [Actinomycetota bacterium]|nr:GGDEF domain-containing protein [Actinomycetota bacterium]
MAAAVFAASAAVVLSRSVRQQEYSRTDARLAAELAGAVRVVEELAPSARARAVRLAASAEVQRALARRDEAALRTIARSMPGVAFEVDGRRVGRTPGPGPLAIPAAVVAGEREVGRVLVDVPVVAVAKRTGLAPGDRLVAGRLDASARSPATVTIDGRRYRSVSTPGGSVRLTALASYEPLAAVVSERRRRVVLAVLGSFGAVALLVVLAARVGRPSKRRLERAADRAPGLGERRSREAAELVGNVLAAGHDVDALLPVILETAVAITGASGARLVADGNELARAGVIETGEPPLVLALSAGSTNDGVLVLHPPSGSGFDETAVQLAEWLAGRASIALQNAHLHRVTRQLATTDELTQLANRRQFDEALAAEVVRAERFRDPVAVVVADLDNFKEVNDRFGHDVGDLVLRAFAAAIRFNVRDVDLPARYGGEEFTVLLPATDAEGGRQLAERLRVAAEELIVDSGGDGPVPVRSSFGVASFPAEPSAAALMRAADRALYRAKAAGKNTVVVAAREAANAQ